MRRSEREIHDPALMDEILRQAMVVYVGLVDEGEAYVVPMNFGYEPGRLYLHSAREGRKVDVLRKNPRVAFTAVSSQEFVKGSEACKGSAKYRCVMGTGRAVFVEDEAERRHGLDALMSKFGAGPFEYAPQALARTLVIRIDIEGLSGKQAGY